MMKLLRAAAAIAVLAAAVLLYATDAGATFPSSPGSGTPSLGQ